MKRRIQTIVFLLLAVLTAGAQQSTLHHLKVKAQPESIVTLEVYAYGYYYDADGKQQRYDYRLNTDTIDIDILLPQGAKPDIRTRYRASYIGLDQWKLMHMTANGQEQTITQGSSSVYYTMPDEDVDLLLTYEFNPDVPGQPSPNGWDPETGELIIDNNNASWPTNFNSSEDYPKVLRYILGGRLDNRMYSLVSGLSYMTNCTYFDFSRTDMETLTYNYNYTGYFKGLPITEIVMPATVKEIRSYTFAESQLQVVTSLALTPPALGMTYYWDEDGDGSGEYHETARQNAFDLGADLVVRVPDEALPFYQAAEGWREFTIVPIDGNFVHLTVNLLSSPSADRLALYKDMQLELTNERTGQVRRLLVNGRNDYQFRYLPLNTQYSLVLRSQTGYEVARVDGVAMGEDDRTLTLPSLKTPKSVTLSVNAGGQTADAAQYTTTWFNAQGEYLSRGNELTNVFEGQPLKYFVRLGTQLAMQYQQPDTVSLTVGTASAVSLSLPVLPRVDATFHVTNEATGEGLSGTTVTVTQLLAGGESGTIETLTTDAQGVARGSLIRSLCNVTVSHDTYGSKTFQANLNDSTLFNIPFRQADGTVLTLNYTYRPAVKYGTDYERQQGYSNMQNLKLSFETYDNGWRYLTDYRQLNPRIIFYETLPEGTNISVSVESTDGTVERTSVSARVGADGNATANIELVERGGLCVGYRETAAAGTGVMLFNSSGKLVQRKEFGQKYSILYLRQLSSGSYTVVAMANIAQMKNVTQFSDLDFLTEGRDYVKNSVYVNEGYEYDVYFDKVPQPTAFMPSNLKSGTAYLNNNDLSVGDYAVMSVSAELLPDVAARAENVRLVCQLPQYCQMVNGSVMKDNTVSNYDYNSWSRQLTVDWSDISAASRIRFCLIPTQAGLLQPEVRLSYTLDGEEHSDLLQSNSVMATAASISVHELVITPRITVKGKAAPQAAVTVNDGNTPIAQTQANARGDWKVTALLADTTALSQHDIAATVVSNGVSYQTEAKSVTYDPNGIVAKKVTMSYFNYHPVHLETMEVVYDLENDIATPSSYGFSNQPGYNTDFTFAIELNDNSPERVYAVALYVYTKGIETEPRALLAKYNEKKNIWVAYDKFNTDVLPYSVAVVPYYHGDPIASRSKIDDVYSDYLTDATVSVSDVAKQFRDFNEREKAAMEGNGELPSAAEGEAILRAMAEEMGIDYDALPAVEADYDALDALVAEGQQIIDQYGKLIEGFGENPLGLNEMGGKLDGVVFGKANGLTADALIAQGYDAVKLNDGSTIYVLFTETRYHFVDLKSNLTISIDFTAPLFARGSAPEANFDEKYKKAQEEIDKYKSYIEMIADGADQAVKLVDHALEGIQRFEDGCYGVLKAVEASGGKYASMGNYFKYYTAKSQLYNSNIVAGGFLRCKNFLEKFKVGDGVGTIAGLYNYIKDINDMLKKQREMDNYYYKVPDPCPNDFMRASDLRYDIHRFHNKAMTFLITNVAGDAVALYGAAIGLAGAAESGGSSLLITLLSIAKIGATVWINDYFDKLYNSNMAYIKSELAALKCKQCDDPDKCCPKPELPEGTEGTMAAAGGGDDCCKDPAECPPFPPKPGPDPGPGSDGILAPSGYVYEGVPSNRVEGVTTTVYYKETVRDMYGDEHELVTLWDAENYAQENPQLTDQNGEYGWDVPMGLWQVKYEKAGYETAYSEWLPVPPPQLDVNQALRQYAQPVVSHVQATQQGVTVGFDKFMKPATLTADNIRVTRSGQLLAGTIELLDSEQDGQQTYASRLRFVPQEALPVGQTLTLTVGNAVESYAGVNLADDFQQQFTIEQAVERLVADSLINVVYGESATLTVSAQPAAAAAGKKVSVKLLSSIIATADADVLTLDQQGRATLRLSGDMHGTTGLLLQLADDEQMQTLVEVSVKDESDFILALPTANYMTDTRLFYGARVELRHEQPGAEIFYTLDGSCPCDLDREGTTAGSHVFRYTEPIVITADTKIKAMAVAKGFTDSDIKELDYTVQRDSVNRRLWKGYSWVSHSQMNAVPLSAYGTEADYALDADGQRTTSLQSATAYVVHSTESHDALLEGYALDATDYALSLHEGWNWLPYPLTLTLTPAEALAYAGAEDGDVIVGEQGFAVCRSGWGGVSWTGTLKKLEPGKAYRYKSKSDKLFYMNSNLGGSTAPRLAHPKMFRWFDQWGQPDRMAIVARLQSADGWSIWNLDSYQVVAFDGDDCRGNAFRDEENSYYDLFLNVLGKPGDTIRFTIYNKETGKNYKAVETLTFDGDQHGTLDDYFYLTIGEETSGIDGITIDRPDDAQVYTLEGVKLDTDRRLQKGVYVRSGHKVVVK